MTKATFGNGVVDTLSYSNRIWLQSASALNSSGQAMYSEGLTYYPNGNPQTITDSVNGNWTYVYDNLKRISTAVSANTGQGCQFNYDAFGNRTLESPYQGSCGTLQLAFSTATNHIDGYCYDAAGNLLDAGGCAPSGSHNQNFYDAYGNLLTGNYNFSDLTSYTPDALGHRVAKYQGGQIQRMYLYGLDGNPVAEMDGSGNWLQTNVHADGMFLVVYQGNDTYFQHTDHLGTIRAQSNSSGVRTMTCSNLPFGDFLNCSGNTDPSGYHFTGKEHDPESGNDYFGARYYASTMGRFVTPDATLVDQHPNDPQSWNLYPYVRNNPLHFEDPNGNDCAQGSNGTTSVNALGRSCSEDDPIKLQHRPWWWRLGHALGLIQTNADQALEQQLQAQLQNGTPQVVIDQVFWIGPTTEAAIWQSTEESAAESISSETGAGSASSAIDALNLQKSLASEEQMGEEGTTIAGTGARVPFRDAQRIANQYGGDPGDWVKKSSSNFEAKDGTRFETHWVENIRTGQRVEYKVKFVP